MSTTDGSEQSVAPASATIDWMPRWLTAIETFFGKAGGYTSGALLLALVALGLRLNGCLDNTTTAAIALGVYGANAIGGAIAAYRK